MAVLPTADTAAPDTAALPAGCCPPLSVRALAPPVAMELAPMFKALSDPVRLRLLSLIASTDEACVCDLTEAFDVTGATVSHHLRVLREVGLVDCERRGTWVYYRVHSDALNLLGNLLTVQSTTAQPTGARTAAAVSARQPTPDEESHQETLISASPDFLRLLADPLRAKLVEALADGPATTSRLVADTGAKQPNVSGHLKQLRAAGVVTAEPRGRYTYYRLVPAALRGAGRYLTDLAARADTRAENLRTC